MDRNPDEPYTVDTLAVLFSSDTRIPSSTDRQKSSRCLFFDHQVQNIHTPSVKAVMGMHIARNRFSPGSRISQFPPSSFHRRIPLPNTVYVDVSSTI